MSPEEYDETPAASPVDRITRYDDDPYGGWGPASAFWPQPATPLSDIEPSTDPWPYPPERYRTPVPRGALPYSATPSPAHTPSPQPSSHSPSPSPQSSSPSPPRPVSSPEQDSTNDSPTNRSLAGSPGKTLFYPDPHAPRPSPRIPRKTLLERMSSPTQRTPPNTEPKRYTILPATTPPLPRPTSNPVAPTVSSSTKTLSEWVEDYRSSLRRRRTPEPPRDEARRKTPSRTPEELEYLPSSTKFIPLRPPRFPTTYQRPGVIPATQQTTHQFLTSALPPNANPAIGQAPPFRPALTKTYPACHWCTRDTHWAHLCDTPHFWCDLHDTCLVPHGHKYYLSNCRTHRVVEWDQQA
jgi:hypothetical protein